MNNLCPPRGGREWLGSRCCLPELAVRPTVLLFPSPSSFTHAHRGTPSLPLHLSTLYNTLINAGNNRYQQGGERRGLHSVANFSQPTCALRYKCRANAPSAKYIHATTLLHDPLTNLSSTGDETITQKLHGYYSFERILAPRRRCDL